ncbi:MAG: YceI family protein, partial [Anaerolineae bacterium]
APASFTEGQPVNFQLTGDLKIRDVTNPETFDVTATLAGDTITGTATTSIKMTDFGFDPPDMAGLLTVGDQMTIVIDLTMQEQ